MTIGVSTTEGRPSKFQAYVVLSDGDTFYLPEADTEEKALIRGQRVLEKLASRMALLKDYPQPTSVDHEILANLDIPYDPAIDGKKPAQSKEGGAK